MGTDRLIHYIRPTDQFHKENSMVFFSADGYAEPTVTSINSAPFISLSEAHLLVGLRAIRQKNFQLTGSGVYWTVRAVVRPLFSPNGQTILLALLIFDASK